MPMCKGNAGDSSVSDGTTFTDHLRGGGQLEGDTNSFSRTLPREEKVVGRQLPPSPSVTHDD